MCFVSSTGNCVALAESQAGASVKVEVQQHAEGPLRQESDCRAFFRRHAEHLHQPKAAACADRVTPCQIRVTAQWAIKIMAAT